MKLLPFLLALLATPAGAVPKVERVMVVVLENSDFAKAMQQPYLKELASRGALLTNHYGLARPSQPNYLALVAGDTFGVATNDNVEIEATHIGDVLEMQGLGWKVYAEGYPGGCFTGKSKGQYMRKHNPFVSFKSVSGNADRCAAHIVPASRLDGDVLLAKVPSFALYVPDDNNNGHDTGVAYADKWLRRVFAPRLASRAFMAGTLFAITFDEGGGSQKIYTVLLGDMVRPGSQVMVKTTHYSLLRTIEAALAIPTLGRKDAAASPIEGIWK